MAYLWQKKIERYQIEESEVVETIQEFAENKLINIDENTYWIAYCTDRFLFEKYEAIWEKSFVDNTVHLLEIRVFNLEQELKIWRAGLGEKFFIRIIDDEIFKQNLEQIKEEVAYLKKFENRVSDEKQFLDIDTVESKKEKNSYVRTTGGGRYHLPIEKIEDATILIRNYIDYEEETGQAYIADWRIVGLNEEGVKRDEI